MALQMPREVVVSQLPSQANETAMLRKRAGDESSSQQTAINAQALQQRMQQQHQSELAAIQEAGYEKDRQLYQATQKATEAAAKRASTDLRRFQMHMARFTMGQDRTLQRDAMRGQLKSQREAQAHELDIAEMGAEEAAKGRQLQRELQGKQLDFAADEAVRQRAFEREGREDEQEMALRLFDEEMAYNEKFDKANLSLRVWQAQATQKLLGGMVTNQQERMRLMKSMYDDRTRAEGTMRSLDALKMQEMDTIGHDPALRTENLPDSPDEVLATIDTVLQKHLNRSGGLSLEQILQGSVGSGIADKSIQPQQLMQALASISAAEEVLQTITLPEPSLEEPTPLKGPRPPMPYGTFGQQELLPAQPGYTEQQAAIKKAGGWEKYVEREKSRQRIDFQNVTQVKAAELAKARRVIILQARASKDPNYKLVGDQFSDWSQGIPYQEKLNMIYGDKMMGTWDGTAMLGMGPGTVDELIQTLQGLGGF